MSSVTIQQGNCLDLIKQLQDESIDCIVTDCPYKIIAGGIKVEYDNMGKIVVKSDGTNCSNKWLKKDSTNIPSAVKDGKMFTHNDIKFSEWLPDVYRVLKKGTHCYIMINSRNLKDLQTEAEKVCFEFQNLLIWDKGNKTPNKYYMQQCEFILMLSKRPARNINDMGTGNLLSIPNIIGTKTHPTQKPVPLLEIMIKNSTNENEIVLDPFMGTGSTGMACKRLNRSFIGYEIDEEYFTIAESKLNSILQEPSLF